MPKLLTASTGNELCGFGRLDFIRMSVSAFGGLAFSTPPWWHAGHTYYAMKSVMGFDCEGWACNGLCDECPVEADCDACDTCQLCAWWTSKTGRMGTCEDPAYDGERKRRTLADKTCGQFMSRWATFDALNEMDRRVPVEEVRIHAAAAESGAGVFSPEDMAEFVETVRRLASLGIIEIPRAQKEEAP